MIKTPLSTVIGGAFWTPGATVINGAKLSFEIVMKKLFANGEQGFYQDPYDLGVMFQDAAGTTAVNASGQPLGLVLDKSKGLVLGSEEFNDASITFVGESSRVSTGVYRLYSSNGAYSLIDRLSGPVRPTAGKAFLISFNVDSVAVAGTGISIEGSTSVIVVPSTIGEKTCIVVSNGLSNIGLKRSSTAMDVQISGISIKELHGNHAYQATSAARPILQDAPRRIDFDTVDDKLITNLPAQVTGCTVIRSVPGVGAQILTNQTIPATYEDNKDHCGLIVINRALTPSETSAIATEFNKRAGV